MTASSGPSGDPPDTDPAVADTESSDPSTAQESPGAEARGKAPRQVASGDVLGRYELADELGEGGMATVFRARDRDLRRDVAVKVLFPHLARRPEVVRRFHREARAAAGLEHPNILRIYDVGGGTDGDPPYIVMELIRGRTLLGEIEQHGAMLAEVAACVGALLADALAAAHAAGIIHRDVKPANVLIASGGRLLLADFGVARLETEDSLVTRTGALLGTPAYMSPEQAGGDMTTAKSDLYSLGATLYQLATGVLPYSGSPAKVISQIATGALVPPMRRRSSCGPDLSRLIERLMATDPAARPASATTVAAELRALAAAGGLGDATEELAAYFADPAAFIAQRTPAVVSALVTAARTAVADQKLPRAMALADRASVLAPDDPAVTALVETVTAGGRSSRRRRALAIGALGLVVAGGASVGVWRYATSAQTVPPLADAAAGDAPPLLADTLLATPPLVDAPPDAAITAPLDAPADAPRRHRDAATTLAVVPDAAPRPDAPPLIAPPVDAPPEPGAIIVRNDVWCEITIDGAAFGQKRNTPLPASAGRHTVVCLQPNTPRRWAKQVDVAPGQTVEVTGTLLDLIEIRFAIDATLDGVPYRKGTTATIRPGNYEVIATDKTFMTLRESCTLRDRPQLGCYPP